MRLLGLTDIHGSIGASILETASTVDCILAAGDITHFGGREEAAAVLDALRSTGKQILLVPGNCDTPEAIEYFDDLGINLHGRIVRFGGMAIAGIGGALPGPMATPNVFSDDEFQTMLAGMEEGIESGEPVIFVSHQPPRQTRLDRVMGFRHVGSQAIRDWLERTNPLLCLCGHIHEAAGIDRLGGTLLVNPGPLRHGNFCVIDIDEKKAVTVTILP